MNDFRASNGVRVVPTNSGMTAYSPGGSWPNPEAGHVYLNADVFAALREFFRAEEDERLGRWRWPKDAKYVIYPPKEGQVMVLHETTGAVVYRYRGEDEVFRRELKREPLPPTLAARAYFDAHPEPRPWHNAKPGEVWALRFEGDADEFAAVRIDGHWKAAEGGWPNEDLITAGRRIWPEEAPNE